MAPRIKFGGFTSAAFSAKIIAVTVAVMISPSLIESLVFFPIKSTNLSFMFFKKPLPESKAY